MSVPRLADAQALEEVFKQPESLNAKAKQLGQNFTQEDRRKRSQLERKLQHLQKGKEKLTRGF